MLKTKYKISVIVSVYNHFNWLKLILDALRGQTDPNYDVIIADDGSNEETVAAIQKYIAEHPELSIRHSWQEDKGWRKNRALNTAVHLSDSDYLIFIDGDCIPHPRFVADHRRLATPGVLMGGRRVETSPNVSAMIESWDTLPKDYFALARKEILRGERKLPQLKRTLRFPFVFGQPLGVRRQGILGANFGVFRDELMMVNGFDERYVDPGTGEDVDIELRCYNNGMIARKASHYALMLHRCHDRLDWSSENNRRLLLDAARHHTTRTPAGIRNRFGY